MNNTIANKSELSFKQITKLIILQMKSIFTNYLLLFVIFLMPVIILFGVGVLIEEVQVFAASFGLMEGLIIGILYGHISYSIDKTTIGHNLSLTKTRQYELFISGAITILIISFGVFIAQLSTMALLESYSIVFQEHYASLIGSALPDYEARDIVWANLSYFSIFMFFAQTFILNISIYFVAGQIFNEYRVFSLFVLTMFLLTLLFGGSVTDTWGFYNPNTQELVSKSSLAKALQGEGDWSLYNEHYETFQPKSWYSYTAFLVPQYFNSQHFFYVLAPGSNFTTDVTNVVGLGKSFPPHFNFMYWSKTDWWWNFALLAPYVYSVLLMTLGVIIKRAKTTK